MNYTRPGLDIKYRKELRKMLLSKFSSMRKKEHKKSAKYIQFLAVCTRCFLTIDHKSYICVMKLQRISHDCEYTNFSLQRADFIEKRKDEEGYRDLF